MKGYDNGGRRPFLAEIKKGKGMGWVHGCLWVNHMCCMVACGVKA